MPMDIKLARLLVPELDVLEDAEDLFMGKLDKKVVAMRADSDVISNAFNVARETFIDLRVPEPEHFLLQGLDLEHLLGLNKECEQLTLVLAPHGLGAGAWQNIIERASAKKISLQVAREVATEFALLDRVQESSLKQVTIANVAWSLRWIPSAPAPEAIGLNHASGLHPSVAEMLSLQATRLARGADPLDQNTFTWMAGTISGGRLAARHVYDGAQKKVVISSREVGNQGPHMGARPPRW